MGEIIVDTTYVEDCHDYVTTECTHVSQQVLHSSAVTGHDSHVIPGHHAGLHGGLHKRAASVGVHHGVHHEVPTAPICHETVKTECAQRPEHHERKVAHPVCHPVGHQVCVPHTVSVPRKVC